MGNGGMGNGGMGAGEGEGEGDSDGEGAPRKGAGSNAAASARAPGGSSRGVMNATVTTAVGSRKMAPRKCSSGACKLPERTNVRIFPSLGAAIRVSTPSAGSSPAGNHTGTCLKADGTTSSFSVVTHCTRCLVCAWISPRRSGGPATRMRTNRGQDANRAVASGAATSAHASRPMSDSWQRCRSDAARASSPCRTATVCGVAEYVELNRGKQGVRMTIASVAAGFHSRPSSHTGHASAPAAPPRRKGCTVLPPTHHFHDAMRSKVRATIVAAHPCGYRTATYPAMIARLTPPQKPALFEYTQRALAHSRRYRSASTNATHMFGAAPSVATRTSVTRGPLNDSTDASSRWFIHSYDASIAARGGSSCSRRWHVRMSKSRPAKFTLMIGTRASGTGSTSFASALLRRACTRPPGLSRNTAARVTADVTTSTTSMSLSALCTPKR
jgi:hypothetical protein